ncbi:phage capsid protein [Acinetobacter corruptisaponis]|uniref:Phage capsid protein n=1 Tax=Acinetobacter corruptisaponis TaxID=3045147 RepID=A0ABY8S803_9GAMM|nr:phage capsid protein [Acinetobacter sp. KCTC 92772]WHP07616.1 phage capsid protein [Acinetobacter sp. KCTC 92772]
MVNENKITAAFVIQYADTYEIAAMQNVSRLLKTAVYRGKIEGESFTINDMGQVEMQASGTRFGDTTWTIPDAGVRTALMTDFDLFIPIESRDLPKLKANPTDKYMKNLINARNRKIDDIIYQALIGGITRVTVNDAGAKSTSTVNLPAGQVILSSFGSGSLKAKILKAKSLFRDNECDEHNGEELNVVYNGRMMEILLSETVFMSADYMAVKMLQEGDVSGKWLGVNWIPYNKLNNGAGGATERRSCMYTSTAVHFGDADITGFDISKRPDKKNISQVGGVTSMAAGRASEQKVVAFDFEI